MILNFDVLASKALHGADADPDEAAKALLIAAEYLRAGKPLPFDLAQYLADAIEASMGKPQAHRNKAFLLELKLTSAGRRPVKTSWPETPGDMYLMLIESGHGQNEAASQIAADFSISESTAVRLGKKAIRDMEEYRQIMREEQDDDG